MVGTYPGKTIISDQNSLITKITIPKDAVKGQTIHMLIEATDNGLPSLKSYQRKIISVSNR
jgi:hypothetical protein